MQESHRPPRSALRLGLILTDYFPYGGLQRDCLGVAKLCVQRGHDVTVVCRTWEGPRPEGIRVLLTGQPGLTNQARNRRFLRLLHGSVFPRERFDRIMAFSRIPGVDVYFGADPCYEALVRRRKPAWFRWTPRYRHFAGLEKALYARGIRTRILLLTGTEIPVFQHLYGTEPGRFEVLPPNIRRWSIAKGDREESRRSVRSEAGGAPDSIVLAFIGSDFRRKGLARAITALAALPSESRSHTLLLVAGQDKEAPFRELARKLAVSSQVRFLGARDDIRRLLLASDLLLHPAHSESAGMILLEAATAGVPVLTTDTCGYAFHIQRAHCGVVLPSPFSQQALDLALDEAIRSPERPAWREAGLRYGQAEDLYSGHHRIVEILEEDSSARAPHPNPSP
ncbi:MAG TPA: glycosyltransferase family 4 protein [Verrucomicrobiales bacterium]|nr:glycosyltransferase family 4 protein [Verrucomicrobiales bacterium]